MAVKEWNVEEKLKYWGYALPDLPKPSGNYQLFHREGNQLYISGVTCKYNGTLKYKGKVGEVVSLQEAYEATKLCTLNHLTIIKHVLGSLESIESVVKMVGYVNCGPGFAEIPQVINGESDFLVQLLGERGQHARCAVGVASLPGNAAVETDLLVTIR